MLACRWKGAPPFLLQRMRPFLALRRELVALELDWDAPPFPQATDDVKPKEQAQLQIDLGNLKDLKNQLEANRLLQESYKHRETGHFSHAIEALRRALEKDPSNAEASNNLAWFLLIGSNELRNATEALPLARRASISTLSMCSSSAKKLLRSKRCCGSGM